ncbi:MFS transporter [Sinomonas sp. R1AF57]|uniref:MFS transporter n=1 Tax=Sinomonas sp. R1AF57 TaxID=2020377 RepID=UPI000B606772|nr:MFS transporter [Sinomonas sp. R1AF57]ASN52265.1 MFS transporter [Sinomonas sp. R1AF57]
MPIRVSILARYAALPALAGPAFIPVALMARLPLAMLTIGALTLASVASGSYALGGLAAGAVGLGSAVGAPAVGWLADRSGQRRVVLVAGLLNAAAMLALVGASYPHGGLRESAPWGVLAASLAAGLTTPQVGPLARARWMALTEGRPRRALELDAALSYEGTADELTFVLGPAVVGALAALVAPWVPLVVGAALTLGFVTAFALHPTARAAHPQPHAAASPVSARSWLLVLVPVAAMVAMGTFFGSTQAGLTAFAGERGAAEVGGLLYAAVGLTSAVAALSVAAWPARLGLPMRWVAAAGAMLAFSLLLFAPETFGSMTAALLLLGVPVGPIMVTVFGIGGRVAPAGRVGTVMTALASGIVAGTALGAALAGALAESGGAASAFAVPVASAGALLALGVVVLVARRAGGGS